MIPVAILAGGLATRMRPLTETIPKALIPINGTPFVDYQLKLLKSQGIENVVFCVGYLGEQLEEHVGDGSKYKMNIAWSYDGTTLLGTGGALQKALPLLGEHFMILYGDSYLPIDYKVVYEEFIKKKCPALMTVYKNTTLQDTNNAVYEKGYVTLYNKKEYNPKMEFIDYGLNCIKAEILQQYPSTSFDLAEIYTTLAQKGLLAGYTITQRFYEIGSPNGLSEFKKYILH